MVPKIKKVGHQTWFHRMYCYTCLIFMCFFKVLNFVVVIEVLNLKRKYFLWPWLVDAGWIQIKYYGKIKLHRSVDKNVGKLNSVTNPILFILFHHIIFIWYRLLQIINWYFLLFSEDTFSLWIYDWISQLYYSDVYRF